MRTFIWLFFTSLFILAIGCSNGSSPIAPDMASLNVSVETLPIGVTDFDENGNPTEGMGALGLFNLFVDPENVKAELTPLRESSRVDVLEVVDITNFMTIAPCVDCVAIKSVAIDNDGNVVVQIGIKHPFGVGNPANPVSGKNRADLHCFNVEGIVVSNAATTNFSGSNQKIAGFRLVNADGYDGYLDASLDEIYATQATIHPYITFFDDYTEGSFSDTNPMGFASVTTPPPSGFLVMPMGSPYDYQNYIFKMSGAMNFIFAVGTTYAVTTETFEDRFSPEYRCPQHNKKAASEVSVLITQNDLMSGLATSTAKVDIRVVDINNAVAVGPAINQMYKDSSVSEIKVEVPGVMTDMLTIAGNTSVSGLGHNPSDPVIYKATITNSASAVAGTYTGLVKVKDAYAPGQNTHPFIGPKDGVKRVRPGTGPLTGLFIISEFATYQVFSIDVNPSMLAPIARLVTNPTTPRIKINQTCELNGTTSSDPDGSIVLYEFDFDWDGVEANFSASVSNATGIATFPAHASPGTFKAGLRVTDDDNLKGYTSVDIIVNAPPTAELVKDPNVATIGQYEVIMLDGRGSSDPDDPALTYEFDYDYTAPNFDIEDSTTAGFISHRFTSAGNFTIALRVKDSLGESDIATVTLQVTAVSNVIFVDAANLAGPWNGSFANPYRYIQDGVDAAGNGYTVWVLSGQYREDAVGPTSSPNAEVTFSGKSNLTLYGEGLPIITLHEYDGPNDISGIGATNCSGLVINGFMFAPSSGYSGAVSLNNCDNAVVERCSILMGMSGFSSFVYATGSDGVTITENDVIGTAIAVKSNRPGFITVDNSPNAVVTLNTITGFSFDTALNARDDFAIIYANSTNSTISKNMIYASHFVAGSTKYTSAISVGATAAGTIVRNNLIYDLTATNRTLGNYAFRGINVDATDVDIYNNTMDRLDCISLGGSSTTSGIWLVNITTADIYNDILTNVSSITFTYGMYKVAGGSITADYNDVYSMRSAGTAERFNGITEGTHGIEENPQYADVLTNDYHLKATSPCKGTGQGGQDMGAYGGPDPLP